MYCQYCGTEMIKEELIKGWQYLHTCSKCNSTCTFSYGDAMGGSKDIYEWKRGEPDDSAWGDLVDEEGDWPDV